MHVLFVQALQAEGTTIWELNLSAGLQLLFPTPKQKHAVGVASCPAVPKTLLFEARLHRVSSCCAKPLELAARSTLLRLYFRTSISRHSAAIGTQLVISAPCAYLANRHVSVTNNLPSRRGGRLQLDGDRQWKQ